MNKHIKRALSLTTFRRGFGVFVAVLTVAPVSAQQPVLVCHSQSINVERANKTRLGATDGAGASLCLYPAPAAVHLEVRQTTIGAILSAMADTYQISYRSSVPLSELRSGRYTGPVRAVIAEVLSGYDYAISHSHSHLDIMVFDKSGGQAVPSQLPAEPTPPPVSEARPPRSEVTVSRSH